MGPSIRSSRAPPRKKHRNATIGAAPVERGAEGQSALRSERSRHPVNMLRPDPAAAADHGRTSLGPVAGETGIDVAGQITMVIMHPLIGGLVVGVAFEGIGVDADLERRTLFGKHRSRAKEMYVSPFMPMNCEYNFRISPPDDDVAINIP